jgi:hypothetical protein
LTRTVRTESARLAVAAAATLSGTVDAPVIFSLAIFFENWILNGGDVTQAKMKLLPEGGAVELRLIRKEPAA